jgi:uncharacterized protein (TIRG00374 family)
MKPEPSSDAPLPIMRVGRYFFLLIGLGLAVHLLIPQLTSLEHSLQVLKQMSIWGVALAVLAQTLSYIGSGYILRAIVNLAERSFSIFKATAIVLAATSFGMVAGGMVGDAAATYRWVRKEGAEPEAASLAGTIPGFLNSSILILVSLAGLIHLLIAHQLTTLQALSFTSLLFILGTLAGVLVWGFGHQPEIISLAHRFNARWAKLKRGTYLPERTEEWITGLFHAWSLILKGGWRGSVLGASLNVLFDMLTLYFLFIAAGHPVSPGVLLTGYGLPLLLGKMAFIIPGGVGVIEGTMVALYDGLGVPDPVNVVVVLGYRILSFWLPLAIGFPLILALQRKNKN